VGQDYYDGLRAELRSRYGALYDKVLLILHHYDPRGFREEEWRTDEYWSEIADVLPRLGAAQSAEDVQHILWQVLEGELDGVLMELEHWEEWYASYGPPARDIWAALQRQRQAEPTDG
jgi:hypothetical protein